MTNRTFYRRKGTTTTRIAEPLNSATLRRHKGNKQMTTTALARPIEDTIKALHDMFASAGDQPTREQRASQCARMSELHDGLNAKALDDGSLFVAPTAAKRLGRKSMGQKGNRRTARDVVTEIFGLSVGQQENMLKEARNPERIKKSREQHSANHLGVNSLVSLYKAIEKVYDRSSPEERTQIKRFGMYLQDWANEGEPEEAGEEVLQIASVHDLFDAIETVFDRSEPEEQDAIRSFCELAQRWTPQAA
jgi:hypothetical protein